MSEENKNEQKNEQKTKGFIEQKKDEVKSETKLYAYIAIGLAAAGAVALGVSFTVLGIYALIASMLFEIASMTFVNLQKKKKDFKWLIYIRIVAYVLFAAAILVFVGGTVWSTEK